MWVNIQMVISSTTAANDKLITWLKEGKSKLSAEAQRSAFRNVLQLTGELNWHIQKSEDMFISVQMTWGVFSFWLKYFALKLLTTVSNILG